MTRKTVRTAQESSFQSREGLYRLQAELCRVLGHPRRLQILDLLADGERSTAELRRALGVSAVNLSQHLGVMKHVGLVLSRQEGREAFHRLAFAEIKEACGVIREVLAQRFEQSVQLARTLHSPRRLASGLRASGTRSRKIP